MILVHIHLKSERLHVHHNFRALIRLSRQEETIQWPDGVGREGKGKGKTRRVLKQGMFALYGASAEVCRLWSMWPIVLGLTMGGVNREISTTCDCNSELLIVAATTRGQREGTAIHNGFLCDGAVRRAGGLLLLVFVGDKLWPHSVSFGGQIQPTNKITIAKSDAATDIIA